MDTSTAPSVSNIHPDSEPAQPAPSEHFGNHPAPIENPAVLQWLVGTGSAPTLGIDVEDDTESSLFSAYRSAIVPRFELANLPSLSARHSGEPKCMAAIERRRAIYTDPAFARAHPAEECECDSLRVMLMHGELDGLPGVLLACDGRREDMQIEIEMERMGMNEECRNQAHDSAGDQDGGDIGAKGGGVETAEDPEISTRPGDGRVDAGEYWTLRPTGAAVRRSSLSLH